MTQANLTSIDLILDALLEHSHVGRAATRVGLSASRLHRLRLSAWIGGNVFWHSWLCGRQTAFPDTVPDRGRQILDGKLEGQVTDRKVQPGLADLLSKRLWPNVSQDS
jgi:hypothetical protein